MKLRSIALTDIRRFAGRTASLTGIGDGITVLAEGNEFGKSTFFDALHAVFFEKHRARGAEVKALQPYGGGAPAVTVEVEIAEGRFQIEKRWLTKAMARISDSHGRQIAADDEAEAWIDRLVLGGLAGPAGLLWVRQGVMSLEPAESTKTERDQLLDARRCLLSSVAGEIDLMTGGRRMDAVLRRVETELSELVTATGKPKAGGAYANAVAETERLEVEIAVLAAKVAQLEADLGARREAEARLQRVEDVAEDAVRRAALTQAQGQFAAAQSHAERQGRAEQALALAQSQLDLALRERDAANQLDADLAGAAATLARMTVLEADAMIADAASRAALHLGDDALAAATDALEAAQGRKAKAQQASLARHARQRLGDLAGRLAQAESLRQQIEASEARLRLVTITPLQVQAVADAELALALLEAERNAAAPRLSVAYGAAERFTIDGQVIDPDMEVSVTRRMVLVVPHVGAVTIDPGLRATDEGDQRRDLAQKQMKAALDVAKSATLAEAQKALVEAQADHSAAQQLTALLTQLAPQGLGALREAHADAERTAAVDVADDVEVSEADIDAALILARQTSADCQQAFRHLQAVARQAGEAVAVARANRSTAAQALHGLQTRAGTAEARQTQRQELLQRLDHLQTTEAGAKADVQALIASAPDLGTAKAVLNRAQSAVDRNIADRQGLRDQLLQLNTRITTQAEAGLEETLEERRGQLLAVATKAAAYRAEAAALIRLRAALNTARAEARDAYFGPVKRELQPLLAILHPDAELLLDDQKLLPNSLRRGPHDEPLDVLSGGTREQLAILTRLAFARLLAQSGSVVPIILDDALVHSDDNRIVAMFTALHRVAQEQQILVFTCRQRAFADLGGTPVQVTLS